MSFNIGLSGIRAASTDLEVTGNNVANASTTGFKQSRTEFSDVYTNSLLGTGSKPVGGGVMVENVRQQFSQGNISGTENALDMAIDGNGFFILADEGEVSYTRAGLFGLDKDGYIVANNSSRVQGFDANSDGVVSGVLGDIQIQVGNQAPALTSQVSARLNLDASEKVLQEQGLELNANGLAIGIADSGIIESTRSTLSAAGRPTDGTGATPPNYLFTGSPPLTGDFLSTPGTSTTTRTKNPPPLSITTANDQFDLSVTDGADPAVVTSGPLNITIPTNNYASLNDLASAIQDEIDLDTAAATPTLNGEISVAAVGGQLVFTNTNTGANQGILIADTIPASGEAAALNLDDLFENVGITEIDKTNSFSIDLTVPSPDAGNRSGSVIISLDENYRSVQQLATSINRQLNNQNGDDYIGVRAQAVETSPSVVPPQFTLELLAVEEGEASVISISSLSASGADVTPAELSGILQNGGTLITGIEGVNNQYPAQQVTVIDPEGNETTVNIPEGTEANEIASIFNQQAGITASANTVMTVPLSSYNNPGNTMSLKVNGQEITATSLPEIADEINGYRGTTLPGFLASISPAGDLVITNEIGRDVKLEMNSPTATDSLVVMGAVNTGPVVLGGSATAASAAAVGGNITFTLSEGYAMENPIPVVSGLFGALSADEFTPIVLNAFDPLDQNTYNHATSVEMYDSLGNSHVLTEFFVKEPLDPSRPNEQNIWAMYVQVDGQNVGDPDSTQDFPENLVPTQSRHELFFNQDGTLDAEATGDIFVTNWDPQDSNGDSSGALNSVNVLEGGLPLTTPAANSNFQITLDGSTQFSSSFSVSDGSQNGYATGRLAGLEVDQEGVIFARYTNGQAQTLGQVALANFRNSEGLTPLGDTGWGESFDSGVGIVGSPRTGSFGQVRSSSLEDSNVDISEELVGLIIAQRNFQASAKTIETMDQVTQTIMNI
ncbi:MAG: flagellar hook protein FlgE [Oleispira sp.]|jgi:flagellar hook protein FlgE